VTRVRRPCRRAIDQLLDKHAAGSEPAVGWQRFTSTAAPANTAACQEAAPRSSTVEAAQGSSWRRTSDAALHSAKVAWGQPVAAGAQASPGSGAWPVAPRAAAKASWNQPLASPTVAKHSALPTFTRGCHAAQQQRPLQPARRSLTGGLTPAAAWDRLCQRSARPGACDESVWVAGGPSSSLEDSDWDVRSSDDRIRLDSSPASSTSGRELEDCSAPQPQSAQSRKSLSPVAIATNWKAISGIKRRSAALLPADPGRRQVAQLQLVQPAKLRRVQAVLTDSFTPGSLQSGNRAAGAACQAVDAVADEVDSPPAERNTSCGMSPLADDIISDDDGPLASLSELRGIMTGQQRPELCVSHTSKALWMQERTGASLRGPARSARQQTLLT